MAKKVQVTLTGNEGKLLIAKAAARTEQVRTCMKGHKLLLCGGTTVSAFSEELGFEPLERLSTLTERGHSDLRGSSQSSD